MKRFALFTLIGLALALARTAHAGPILITDPYGAAATNYPSDGCAPNACDVIGAKSRFDIRSIAFTSLSSAQVTAVIRMNYNSGDAALGPFPFAGRTLEVGDLLFSNGVHKYGVPLHTHTQGGALVAGQLYSATNFLTSSNGLFNLSPLIFRTVNNDAWVDANGALAIGSPGTVTSVNIAGPEVQVTVSFAPGGTFWNDVISTGLSVHFASAVCANDVIDGEIRVPGPGSLFLLFTGVVGAAVAARRRRAA